MEDEKDGTEVALKRETWRCIDDGTGRNVFYISSFNQVSMHDHLLIHSFIFF
jgi:hypothetical protein